MNKKLFFLYLTITFFLSVSCEDTLKPVPDENLIVVREYIYEGQPVKDIVLMSTLALDDESTEPTPIDSAEVILSRGNEKFILEPVYSNDTTETDTTFSSICKFDWIVPALLLFISSIWFSKSLFAFASI